MTKDPRNPNAWNLREIEQDSAGYLAAQQAHKADQARAGAHEAEKQDRARFEAEYVLGGGTAAGAVDAYRKLRDERATEAARTADEAARRGQRGTVLGKV